MTQKLPPFSFLGSVKRPQESTKRMVRKLFRPNWGCEKATVESCLLFTPEEQQSLADRCRSKWLYNYYLLSGVGNMLDEMHQRGWSRQYVVFPPHTHTKKTSQIRHCPHRGWYVGSPAVCSGIHQLSSAPHVLPLFWLIQTHMHAPSRNVDITHKKSILVCPLFVFYMVLPLLAYHPL